MKFFKIYSVFSALTFLVLSCSEKQCRTKKKEEEQLSITGFINEVVFESNQNIIEGCRNKRKSIWLFVSIVNHSDSSIFLVPSFNGTTCINNNLNGISLKSIDSSTPLKQFNNDYYQFHIFSHFDTLELKCRDTTEIIISPEFNKRNSESFAEFILRNKNYYFNGKKKIVFDNILNSDSIFEVPLDFDSKFFSLITNSNSQKRVELNNYRIDSLIVEL